MRKKILFNIDDNKTETYTHLISKTSNLTRLKDSSLNNPDTDITTNDNSLNKWQSITISLLPISSGLFLSAGLIYNAAGIYSIFTYFIVILITYCYKEIYGENTNALPVNGGIFNVMLHTTSKNNAAAVGCITLILYLLSGLVNVIHAIEYLYILIPNLIALPIIIIIFAIIALIMYLHYNDSTKIMFTFLILHTITYLILIAASFIYIGFDQFNQFTLNYNLTTTNWFNCIISGLGPGLLSIVGYDTSTQYIEQQFNKSSYNHTLQAMFKYILYINPLLIIIITCIIPYDPINQDITIFSTLAEIIGGNSMKIWLCIDAFIILSCTIYTCYITSINLFIRLAKERCLPSFLLYKNHDHQYIYSILSYFILNCILTSLFHGIIKEIVNVYNLSFLLILFFVFIGNILLKMKRGQITRDIYARKWILFLTFFILVISFIALLLDNNALLLTFILFYIIIFTYMLIIMYKSKYYSWLLLIFQYIYKICSCNSSNSTIIHFLKQKISTLQSIEIIFYVKKDVVSIMNKAIQYVLNNEDINKLKMIHIYQQESMIPIQLPLHIYLLNKAYPSLSIELVLVQGTFSPNCISKLSTYFNIPHNYMFIACPSAKLTYNLKQLGGLRLITH